MAQLPTQLGLVYMACNAIKLNIQYRRTDLHYDGGKKGYICGDRSHIIRYFLCRRRSICNSTLEVEQNQHRKHQDADYSSSNRKTDISSCYFEKIIHIESLTSKRSFFQASILSILLSSHYQHLKAIYSKGRSPQIQLL